MWGTASFNILTFDNIPTVYVFCMYYKTNSVFCPIQHSISGFNNRDEKCVLRSTKWIFKIKRITFRSQRINLMEIILLNVCK
jgi:hypothetical protein